MSLYVGDRLVCRSGCTLDGDLRRVTYTRYCISTIDFPVDKQMGARNMYRIGINIYEKRIVRQVGYLQEFLLESLTHTEHLLTKKLQLRLVL
jgi:hypothetical protein